MIRPLSVPALAFLPLATAGASPMLVGPVDWWVGGHKLLVDRLVMVGAWGMLGALLASAAAGTRGHERSIRAAMAAWAMAALLAPFDRAVFQPAWTAFQLAVLWRLIEFRDIQPEASTEHRCMTATVWAHGFHATVLPVAQIALGENTDWPVASPLGAVLNRPLAGIVPLAGFGAWWLWAWSGGGSTGGWTPRERHGSTRPDRWSASSFMRGWSWLCSRCRRWAR